MVRMAKNTRQPKVLQELFEALGNDPFIIAECLARPALVEHFWYAYDQTIHGDLKQRVEAEIQTHNALSQMKQLSGKYSEIELVRHQHQLLALQCHPHPVPLLAQPRLQHLVLHPE
jgi:hypothetical protein